MSDPACSATGSATELSRLFGRRPRVALLVYNDAQHDSRVLKTAASLRNAGATVRIFAVTRRRAGYAEGAGLVGEAIAVERAPEFELARYAAGRLALRVARRLTGSEAATGAAHHRVDAARARGAPETPETPGTATSVSHPGPTPGVDPVPTSGPTERALCDIWLRTYRTLSLGLYWWHTAQAAARWQPDVIHANDGNTLAPALWIGHRSGAQIVYDSHELWLHRNVRTDRPLAPWVEACIEKWAIGRAAGVITVSPSIATWLQRRYRLRRRPTVVRNAPRTRCAKAPEAPVRRGRLRELANLTDHEQVIAYGGRITTSRGIEETVHALAMLPQTVHFVLLGYGEPDYLARLHTLINHHRIGDRVHLVGAVGSDEVSEALADADVSVVFVRPICKSYEFSLPNKLFESIHAGVPVVAADLPDTAALVRKHQVGETFATADPVDMARTIEAVLADPEAYRSAARRAASLVTWQHEEVGLLALYAAVLAP